AWCTLVPSGPWHTITNIGATPMQVYTIYAPAHHKPGKVQATAVAAEADKDDEPAAWSVQPKHAPDKHQIGRKELLDGSRSEGAREPEHHDALAGHQLRDLE